jgi:hypothetical protein
MKLACTLILAALAAALCPAPARAQVLSPADDRFPPMAQLRKLAGLWVGDVRQSTHQKILGKARIKYEVVSSGYAVMERLLMGKYERDEMVSVYHQEGDQLMMTHFCSSNTQPRLRTKSWTAPVKELKLEFLDSTNILNANMMNITFLKLEFLPDGGLRQTWQSHDPKLPATVIELHRQP